MKINIIELNSKKIAEVVSDNIVIADIQDALDLMASCHYDGADGIVIYKHNITEGFFDLRTRIAGEILQKFSTYGVRLAIVGDFSTYTSKSLRDFIYESNKAERINFVASLNEAEKVLSK